MEHSRWNITSLGSFTNAMSLYFSIELYSSWIYTSSMPSTSTGGAVTHFPLTNRVSSVVFVWCSPKSTDRNFLKYRLY